MALHNWHVSPPRDGVGPHALTEVLKGPRKSFYHIVSSLLLLSWKRADSLHAGELQGSPHCPLPFPPPRDLP